MPTAEEEAWAVARAAPADGEGGVDCAVFQAEYERRIAERRERLTRDASAAWRAMDGWGRVTTREDWADTVRRADRGLDDGSFLIDRLGAERHLDPPLMAVLLALRRRLIDEHGATDAADLMLIDLAVLSYYHTLRINGWIGNVAQWLESEFFAKGSLSVQPRYGWKDDGRAARLPPLLVEEIVQRLAEQLLPLLDRSNRMMLRNLKALRERRRAPAPSVSIGSAGQVNVAQAQVNSNAARSGAQERKGARGGSGE
jgi:hypothetical protein